MLDLILSTNEIHFETFRSLKLGDDDHPSTNGGVSRDANGESEESALKQTIAKNKPRRLHNPKFKEEEDALKKFFTEQVKAEEQRFRQWETNIVNERNRLNLDLEEMQAKLKSLEELVKKLQINKR